MSLAPTGTGLPLLTYVDDATGERTALSGEALGGWVARTASLLTDGCGLGAGCTAAVLLRPHWQTAAVLFGAWSAGLTVSFRPASTAGLAAPPGGGGPYDAVFAGGDRIRSMLEDVPAAPHRFALGLAPGGAPLTEVPDGYRDYVAEVTPHRPGGRAPMAPFDWATLDGTTFGELGALAREIGARSDLRPGDRVLVDAAAHEQPLTWLLAPLAAGATVVLCANLDPDRVAERMTEERVTRRL